MAPKASPLSIRGIIHFPMGLIRSLLKTIPLAISPYDLIGGGIATHMLTKDARLVRVHHWPPGSDQAD